MISRRSTWTAALALAILAAPFIQVSASHAAGPPDGYGSSSKASSSKASKAGRGKEWAKATKESEIVDGLFRIYKSDKTWHLQINPEQFGQQYLMALTIGRGIGSKYVLGGLTLSENLVRFEKVGDKVLLYKDDARYVAPGDEDLQRAIALSFAPSPVHAFKIAAEEKDTVLVDLQKFILSDYADIATIRKQQLGGTARVDGQRSTFGKLKAFPLNMEMEADLVYTVNREKAQIVTVTDDRWIPITIRYSLMQLPEPGFVPRLLDDRVGYFPTSLMDFSREDDETYFVHYSNRWRLEKKNPGAALSEPVKPITFYLENTIPEYWRPYIKQGVEAWNTAFEAAGFKNAIVAKMQPEDDEDWDAADIRYSTIRWISSDEPSFGAIGPSRIDPRTGEIFDADILIEAFWIQAFKKTYRRYAGPETIQEALYGMTLKELETMQELGLSKSMCRYGTVAFDSGNMLNLSMHLDGLLPPGSPVPDEFIGQSLVELTLHEVGHTLGLRHNFQSSVATPRNKLEDIAYLQQYGITGSVMDYPTVNIPRTYRDGHIYFTQVVGPYDIWAIRYGYTPTAAQNPYDEKELIERIAEDCAKPGHEYGTDEDTYPMNALDPRNHIFDLGNDPLAFGQDRANYLNSLWSQPEFESRILARGEGYQVLRNAMSTLFFQYARSLSFSLKYIGGQEVSRGHYGDPDVGDPLVPISADEQRAALDFLTDKVFSPEALDVPSTMLNRMIANRNWSWQHNLWQGRIDYPFYSMTLALQKSVLDALMNPNRLARVREAESRQANPLTVAELYNQLTGSIWGEFGIGASSAPARQNPAATLEATSGSGTRRDLQRAYVDNLIYWVTNPAPTGTDDARALARLQLTRIEQACARKLSSGSSMNDALRAHLIETRDRSKRALEADMVVEG